ncbi:CRISPR system precrRNA processing endoribonuclease RAMP protein Cas6 [Pseudofrankia sp. DC12]|uniref:CRISPR system precrRNA processing endoribonuclease RAMP protein Cas6 n=1 Tax=Pseudofrankia sp. DC12 TaxID=683315 RepID=UPI0005F76DEC|nr:CRISPR system precrRNA processing endoribonuclease RAMP protein Cas6 [Pseudofrankia sp. DC12]
MPSMLVLRLAGAIPDIAPRWLLGAASAICEPSAAEALTQARPFSVAAVVPVAVEDTRPEIPQAGNAPVQPDADRGGAGQRNTDRSEVPRAVLGASWRLGWLDDDALPPGWPPAEARFGSQVRTVLGAELRRRSYAELAQGTPARHARLTMTTPTFFARDGRDLPLPDPALVIRGLLARWNSYAPGPLRIGADDARALVDAVYLDGMWGASADVELGHGLRQTGFVGQADLRLLAATSDYIATMFTALTRFAAYAGVGARTAYGFGAVDVDVVEVPVPRRPAPAANGPRRAGTLTPTRPPRLTAWGPLD